MACCCSTTNTRALQASFRLAPHISATLVPTSTSCTLRGSDETVWIPFGIAKVLQRWSRRASSSWLAALHRAADLQPRPAHPPPSAPLSRRLVLRAGVLAPLGWAESTLLEAACSGGPRSAVAAMSTSAASGAATASPSGAIVVYVTVPNAEAGETLGSKLVEAKLAACVNILPGLTSIYTWKGKVEKDSELLLIIKSRQELLTELTTFVRANHPYEEPEVIALPILGGSPSYLQWLMDNTRAAGAGAAVDAA